MHAVIAPSRMSTWAIALIPLLLVGLGACSDDNAGPQSRSSAAAAPTRARDPSLSALGDATSHAEARAAESVANAEAFHPAEIERVEQTLAGGSKATERMGEDWAEFLGPRGTGVSGETGLLEQWPEAGPPVLWKKRIGEGYS